MSLKDLKKQLERGKKEITAIAKKTRNATVATATAVVTLGGNEALAQNTADKVKDKEEPKVEKTISWGDKEREVVTDTDGTEYVFLDENNSISFPQDTNKKRRQVRKDFRRTRQYLKEEKQEYLEDQKTGFENEEADKEEALDYKAGYNIYGKYDPVEKNIVMSDFSKSIEDPVVLREMARAFYQRKGSTQEKLTEKIKQLHDFNDSNLEKSVSLLYDAVKIHEAQHETADKENSYAPGVSTMDYAVTNKYDEIQANVAELRFCIYDYQHNRAKGMSKEESAQAFNENGKFDFYKKALFEGLDPQSKEGKKLLVQGTINMWEQDYEDVYGESIANIAVTYCKTSDISLSDAAMMMCDNPKEVRRRITNMFRNINNNEVSRSLEIPPAEGLEEFLPEELTLLPQTKKEIFQKLEKEIGLTVKEQTYIRDTDKKTYKGKMKDLIRKLRGHIKSSENKKRPAATNTLQKDLSLQNIANMGKSKGR